LEDEFIMSSTNYPVIVREAWPSIFILLIIAVLVLQLLGWVYSLPVWFLIVVILYLFRDPDRDVPSVPLAVVSPVDGVVLSIQNQRDPYLGREAIHVVLKMNSTGIFSIRGPLEGKVHERWFLDQGQQYPGANDVCNQTEISSWIQSDEGDDVILTMHRNKMLPRCYVHEGERVGQGQRCGFQTFGGIVGLYLATNSHIEIKAGDKVFAGKDILATLRHQEK
jgi:phosphatidylserine decarboxylase